MPSNPADTATITTSTTATRRYKTIRRVTLLSAVANTLLTLFKLIIGTIGHSAALVADGVHSFSDLLTDFLIIIAAKSSSKGPDLDHPYGHQRIETVATTLMASLLIAVGVSLAYHNLQKLFYVHSTAPISWPVWVVAISAIIIKEWFYHYTMRASKEISSPLLASNAWHHRSDVFVSAIVLLSIIGHKFGLSWCDAVGAIIIAILIIKIGGKMIWESVSELIDTAIDPQSVKKIKQAALTIPGAHAIHQIRSRTLAGQIYLDLHIMVSPTISVSEGHHIGEQAEALLRKENDKIHDVTVHIDPEDDEINSPSLQLPNRTVIENTLRNCWGNIDSYADLEEIQLHYLDGKLSLDVTFNCKDAQQLQNDIALYAKPAFKALPGLEKINFKNNIYTATNLSK